jgi:hypothetical protein
MVWFERSAHHPTSGYDEPAKVGRFMLMTRPETRPYEEWFLNG